MGLPFWSARAARKYMVVTDETMELRCSPTARSLRVEMVRTSACPAGSLGKMLHHFREWAKGGSTTIAAVHMSALGPSAELCCVATSLPLSDGKRPSPMHPQSLPFSPGPAPWPRRGCPGAPFQGPRPLRSLPRFPLVQSRWPPSYEASRAPWLSNRARAERHIRFGSSFRAPCLNHRLRPTIVSRRSCFVVPWLCLFYTDNSGRTCPND